MRTVSAVAELLVYINFFAGIPVNEIHLKLVHFCYVQGWNDYRLRWNATDFGNIVRTFVHASKIWKPELLLANK